MGARDFLRSSEVIGKRIGAGGRRSIEREKGVIK